MEKRTSRLANLVICCAGDDSLHREWLPTGQGRGFDLLLIDFSSRDNSYHNDAQWCLRARGPKWPLVTDACACLQQEIARYDCIWIPDDDMAGVTHKEIVRMFALFRDTRLQLAQPAVRRGDAAHDILRPIEGASWHETNFVEIMCPLFTGCALAQLSFTFSESRSGWGLDFWWAQLSPPGSLGVLDEVTVVHNRRCTGHTPLYEALAAEGVNPAEERHRLLTQMGVPEITPRVLRVHPRPTTTTNANM